MPQSQYNMTGRGIGQTVGRYGLGAFGGMVGGLPGAWIGSKIGGPLGGLAGAGLSTLFGPHGLQAAFGSQGLGGIGSRGISMLIGNRAGAPSYTGPNNLFGATAPATAGGSIDPSFAAAASAGYTSVNPTGAAPTVGYTGLGVSNYGQLAKGIPSFARTNQANILSRNLL